MRRNCSQVVFWRLAERAAKSLGQLRWICETVAGARSFASCSTVRTRPLTFMASFTPDQIDKALSAKSQNLSPEDIRRVANNKTAVIKMIEDFPAEYDKAKRQALLLFDIIRETSTGKLSIHTDDLKAAAGALIYLGAPMDIIPDDEADGYADDAAVIGLAIQRMAKHVENYCATMGLNPADYLD